MLRAVLLFLIVVAVLGAVGKWRLPRPPRGPAVEAARKCSVCGAYVVGPRPEPCARADCRFRQPPDAP